MKQQTAETLKSILAFEPELSGDQIQRALEIMDRSLDPNSRPFSIIRYKEAMSLLGVSHSTLINLINKGLFTRAYGSGSKLALGITAESYNRFIHDYSRKASPQKAIQVITPRDRNRAAYEMRIRKIRWAYHFTAQTTKNEKCEAIAKLLSAHKGISLSMACIAAGISEPTYRHFIRKISRPRSERTKRIGRVADIISRSFPVTSTPPSVSAIEYALRQYGIKTSRKTISALLDKMGYARIKKESPDHA